MKTKNLALFVLVFVVFSSLVYAKDYSSKNKKELEFRIRRLNYNVDDDEWTCRIRITNNTDEKVIIRSLTVSYNRYINIEVFGDCDLINLDDFEDFDVDFDDRNNRNLITRLTNVYNSNNASGFTITNRTKISGRASHDDRIKTVQKLLEDYLVITASTAR